MDPSTMLIKEQFAVEPSSSLQQSGDEMNALEVSVIIPHYNDLSSLKACIRCLSQQTFASDRFEVIVSDNNSSMGIEAVSEAVEPFARVVLAIKQGAAEARNAGAAEARGKVLAFTDADCQPAQNWLELGLEAISNADIVGGRIKTISKNQERLTPVEAFELVFAFKNESYIKEKGFSVTANLFVKRSVFEAVGKFRPGVSEDKDWCLRAGSMNYRLSYENKAVIDHPARSSWQELTKKWKRLLKEEYALLQEKPLSDLRWLVKNWFVLFSPLVHVALVIRAPGLNMQDRINAISILFCIRLYRFAEAHRLWLQKLS